jgi:addiction module RelE/StbE family toxin
MNSNYKVQWTQSARNDLLEIAQYIAKDSVEIALEKVDLIEEKVNGLCTFPFKGKNVPELEDYNEENYKQLIVYPWRVIYSVTGENVTVLTIIDGRRDLQDLLLKKLMK